MRIVMYLAVAAISIMIYGGRALAVAIDTVVDAPHAIVVALRPYAHAIADFCMTPFRLEHGAARQFIDRYILAAFRVIGLLKPEYDESLATDGQNFTRVETFARC